MDVPVDQGLKRLNVLTLDGGGIRGISSILILQDLMQEINTSIRQAQPNRTQHPNVEPHDIFNLVAGTSTGGLIAIMLGKLGMSLAECVEAYDELSTTIFSAKHLRARLTLGLAPARYSGKGLEKCVVKLLKDKKFDGKLKMPYTIGIDKIACCVICREHQNESRYSPYKPNPVCICTLRCPDPIACLVCEAARATSAAPTFFPIQKINGRSFADGGIEFNNPSYAIYYHYSQTIRVAESRRTSMASVTELPAEEYDAQHGDLDFSQVRIVNLGTGSEPKVFENPEPGLLAKFQPAPFRMAVFLKRTLTKTATSSERIADYMKTLAHTSGGQSPLARIKYERFSDNTGVCYIKLDRYKKLEEIKVKTRAYLADAKTRKEIKRVAAEIARDYLDAQLPRPRPATLTVPGGALPDAQSSPQNSSLQSPLHSRSMESHTPATTHDSMRISGETSVASSTVSKPRSNHDDRLSTSTPVIPARTSAEINGPAESMVHVVDARLAAQA